MEFEGLKDDLHRYLQTGREALLWKLEGLSEYHCRRPMTPTGTNVLGLVKHVASVEAGYLGDVFGRPFSEPLPWFDKGAEPNADMWATADESREHIVGLYRRVWANSDGTLEALDLDTLGRVPWWPAGNNEVTLHLLLLHMIAETHRHVGHADIIRETIDGSAGGDPTTTTLRRVMPPGGPNTGTTWRPWPASLGDWERGIDAFGALCGGCRTAELVCTALNRREDDACWKP